MSIKFIIFILLSIQLITCLRVIKVDASEIKKEEEQQFIKVKKILEGNKEFD